MKGVSPIECLEWTFIEQTNLGEAYFREGVGIGFHILAFHYPEQHSGIPRLYTLHFTPYTAAPLPPASKLSGVPDNTRGVMGCS